MVTLHGKRLSYMLSGCLELGLVLCPALAHAQVLNVDQDIEVHDLASIVSPSEHSSDVLKTSLATVIHDPDICCRNTSGLADSLERADPKSLQDVAAKLNGRHLLADGRPVMVHAAFFPVDQANAGYLVKAFTEQHALLMQWNSHIYVVHGLVYFWNQAGSTDTGASIVPVVRKFLLWDTRYSDSRRDKIFNRDTDDLNKVQGFLFIEVKLE